MKPGYFKRIFSVILAVVMIVTCIASCEVTAAARPARPTFKITKRAKKDSVTLLGKYLEKNGKETPLCSII